MSIKALTQKQDPIERKAFRHYVEDVRPQIERALVQHQPVSPSSVKTLFNDAVNYSLFPGGKRLRPVLTLLGAEIVGGERDYVMASAVAIEFTHTSALIFDDLPCMDNASERRGKPALHIKYGEGLAVLVALSLLNASYGLIFNNRKVSEPLLIRAHSELVECIGANGMVAGQAVDLTATSTEGGAGTRLFSNVSHEEFESERNLKTSALMRTALRTGAILSGATEEQLNALSRFAYLIGNAYQTGDDLIDVDEDATYTTQTLTPEIDVKDAKKRIFDFTSQAKESLVEEFGQSKYVNILCEMADYVSEMVPDVSAPHPPA